MGNFGKRMSEARASFEGKENLSVEEAVALVKGNAKAKFDETIEIAMNLGGIHHYCASGHTVPTGDGCVFVGQVLRWSALFQRGVCPFDGIGDALYGRWAFVALARGFRRSLATRVARSGRSGGGVRAGAAAPFWGAV